MLCSSKHTARYLEFPIIPLISHNLSILKPDIFNAISTA